MSPACGVGHPRISWFEFLRSRSKTPRRIAPVPAPGTVQSTAAGPDPSPPGRSEPAALEPQGSPLRAERDRALHAFARFMQSL